MKEHMKKIYSITFLGPVGSTFSHKAYIKLASLFDAPPDDGINQLVVASRNGEVISKTICHGGYGAIAMETYADGRVAEPLESFIELLALYHNESVCPIHIIGAVKMKPHFVLMAQHGIEASQIKKLVSHIKAFGGCRRKIKGLGLPTEESLSNGKAAEDVASNPLYRYAAAIGPASAAEKYGLNIIDPYFGDQEALTTFFLVGPSAHAVIPSRENRSLIVFKTAHTPGALVDAILPFKAFGLNIMQIHSMHTGNGTYDFVIEIECAEGRLQDLHAAVDIFRKQVAQSVVFGPFPVIRA